MRRWVWPIVDANRALKAAIRTIGGKGRYRDLEIRALEARHFVRRLTPATLGVHLRDLFAMNRNKQRCEYDERGEHVKRRRQSRLDKPNLS